MPPTTQRYDELQSSFLSAIRGSQAAVIDGLRVWSDIGQQLTRDLRLPTARIDLADGAPPPYQVPRLSEAGLVLSRAGRTGEVPR